MTRRAVLTEGDVARALRAAKKQGVEQVEIRSDGTIVMLLKAVPHIEADNDNLDDYERWKREDDIKKTSRGTHRQKDPE